MKTPQELWPRIVQPPSEYFDVDNRTGSSPFKPGLLPSAYDPFLEYFEERAQTATAQARLDRRKGRLERAAWYESAAAGWRAAARRVLLRKQRELFKPKPIEVTCD